MNFEIPILIFLFFCFIWSGFVRTGFGFGSNALLLPILLLVIPDPILIIPIIAAQTVLLSGFEVLRNLKKIDWRTLIWIKLVTTLPILAGVYGLITLPDQLLVAAIYLVTIGYAISYIFPRRLGFDSKIIDYLSLILGGYISGFSFTGGPPIVAVAVKKIPRELFRNSMLALWVFIGGVKLTTLYLAGVEISYELFLFLLPAVLFGHFLGLRFHDRISQSEKFYRIIGSVLLLVSLLGLAKILGFL